MVNRLFPLYSEYFNTASVVLAEMKKHALLRMILQPKNVG
jgi:hypothetical protein